MKALRLDALGTSFILVWSSGYLVGSIATRSMAPLAVTMWRFAIAAALLAVVAVVRRESWPRGREALALLGVGVPMFAVQFGALYSAMADGLTAGTTSLIACSSPLVVGAIGAASGWERLRPLQWLGIALGVLGVLVTLADRVGRPPNAASLLWALTGLAGLAVGTTLQSRVSPKAGAAAVASVEAAAGFAVLAVWAPLDGDVALPLTGSGLASFAWLAVVAGLGAPLLLFALVRRRGATGASSHLFVVPGDHRVGRVAAAEHASRSADRGGPGDRGGGADADHRQAFLRTPGSPYRCACTADRCAGLVEGSSSMAMTTQSGARRPPRRLVSRRCR